MATLTPTKQQQDVLNNLSEYFAARFGPDGYTKVYSLFLSAVAGAGKTSTIKMICRLLAQIEAEYGVQLEACSLSFNKVIAVQGNAALKEEGLNQICKTTNSLGNGILKEAGKQGQCKEPKKLNTNKYKFLAEKYIKNNLRKLPNLPYSSKERLSNADLAGKIKKLTSAARLTYCDASSAEALAAIVEHYPDMRINIISPYWHFIWQAVAPLIQEGIALYNAVGELDFDDQIFLPLALDVAVPIYDFIAIDEAQDLNRVRTELIKRSIKPNGAMFFVGDRRQAIQGFAFADTAAVDNIIRDTGAIELPLTCCWRCDANIIRIAQAINPEIQARPGAQAGIVELATKDYTSQLRPGYHHPKNKDACIDADMVLCRVTADLVANCLAAIRAGIPAMVRGKDIGSGIISKIDEILKQYPEGEDLHQLTKVCREYFNDYAMAVAGDENAENEISKLGDQVDTIEALVSGYFLTKPEDLGLDALKKFIESKFSDENEIDQTEGPRPVVFSTVHKAKGLETDRVFILRPDLLPHPLAMKNGKEWQMEQEENIAYVAVTRPKHELYFVGGIPDYFSDVYFDIMEEQELPAASIVVEEAEKIIVEAAATPAPEKKSAGRKALAEADKPAKMEAFVDTSLKQAFTSFVEMLQGLDEEQLAEILPNQEKAITPTGKLVAKKVSGADVVQAALLNFAPFKSYFETSEQFSPFVDRKDRKQAAREQYQDRKKKKPVAIEDETEGLEVMNDDPEPDGPGGGGQPAPSIYDQLGFEDYDPSVVDTLFNDNLGVSRLESVSLFDDLPEATPAPSRRVQRIFFQCPRCNKHWYADYYVTKDGQMYREQDGQIIYAQNDFLVCPFGCNNEKKWFRRTLFKRSYSSGRKCDSRCYNAHPGSMCSCSCGGVNHATGGTHEVTLVGKPLLQLSMEGDNGEE